MIQSLSTWIMSITGVVCLSVLVELILPNGQMNKYIRGIFSFIILLVIIAPIPKFLNKDFNYSNLFGETEIVVQDDYLYQINLNKVSAMQNSINKQIEESGYLNVEARIDSDIFASSFTIKAVYVDLTHLIISDNAKHTNITEIKKDILKISTTVTSVTNDKVVFEE